MSLVTRCPACSTRFKVVPDQIRIAAGWVRCGHCGEIFDASAHLLPRDAPAAAPTPAAPPAPNDEPQAAAPPPEPQPWLPHAAESPVMATSDAIHDPATENSPPRPTESTAGFLSPERIAPHPLIEEQDTAAAWAAPSLNGVAPTGFGGQDEPSPIAANASAEPTWTTPYASDPTETSSSLTGDTLPTTLEPFSPSASAWPLHETRPDSPEAATPLLDAPEPDPAQAAEPWYEPPAPVADTPQTPKPEAVSSIEVPPSFVAAARRRAFWASRPVRILLWLSLAVLVLGLALQWLLVRRDWVAARAPQLAPTLTALCVPLNCRVGPYRHLDAIIIDSSTFNRVAGNQFRFSVSLRNEAALPVASPALELTLTNSENQPVVRRVLTAAELGAPLSLPAQGEFATTQSLTVAAPVDPATVLGYRLTAFYP